MKHTNLLKQCLRHLLEKKGSVVDYKKQETLTFNLNDDDEDDQEDLFTEVAVNIDLEWQEKKTKSLCDRNNLIWVRNNLLVYLTNT